MPPEWSPGLASAGTVSVNGTSVCCPGCRVSALVSTRIHPPAPPSTGSAGSATPQNAIRARAAGAAGVSLLHLRSLLPWQRPSATW